MLISIFQALNKINRNFKHYKNVRRKHGEITFKGR